MTEILKIPNNEETINAIAELSQYTTIAHSMVFSWFTLSFSIILLLIFSYILGKRAVMKNVIIDTNLKFNLENVEQTKKKLKKKMSYWNDTIDLIKWFIFFLVLIIIIYGVLYYLNPEYVEIVKPVVKNIYFVQGFAFLIIFLFCFIRYAIYKQNVIKNAYNDIDQEAQLLFEDIINKMGSKLTKSMAEALLKKRALKETKGYCKKEICTLQKKILDKKSKSAQFLLNEIGKFDWCPLCSSQIEGNSIQQTNNNSQNEIKKNITNEVKEVRKLLETDETKCRMTIDQNIQTEEFICNKNCGKRFFKYCEMKGGIYKGQIDEITILENQLRQMEAEFNRENNILK